MSSSSEQILEANMNVDLDTLFANPETATRNKKWFTEQIKRQQAHEFKMQMLRIYESDPDIFWKAGLLGGAALASLGAALGLAGIVIGGAEGDKEGAILPGGIVFSGTTLFAGGLTVSAFSALMLLLPRLFGEDGLQFEASTILGDISVG